MIFNKPNTDGVAEIHALVGVSYYRNNDFAAIRPHIIDETRTVIKHIGRDVYDRAEKHYFDAYDPEFYSDRTEGADHTDDKLVNLIQTAIALMAIFRYGQANVLSHEDVGRKIKIDPDHEKLPWEWMYDRDDAAMLRRAYIAIDTLIEFLENAKIEEWLQSQRRMECRSLLLATWQEFERVYPIDESPRFFYELTPFIREAQERWLPDAMTLNIYSNLQNRYIANAISSEDDKRLLFLVQRYLPLRTIEIACGRLSVSVFPEGIVQRFMDRNGQRNSRAASDEARREYARTIGKQADDALNDVKRFIQQITAGDLLYPIMPKNDRNNKFFIA